MADKEDQIGSPESSSVYDTSFSEYPSESVVSFPASSSAISYNSIIDEIFADADNINYGIPRSKLMKSLKTREEHNITKSQVKSVPSELVDFGSLPKDSTEIVSQTNLINSIGRPFNRNHAKDLVLAKEEEFVINRRVSQIGLEQIIELGEDIDPDKIKKYVKIISSLSFTIGIIGATFFVLVASTASLKTPMEFLLHFLNNFHICKAFYMIGALQPVAVAAYCYYALINLKHIRGFYLRVPIALIVPFGAASSSLFQLSKVVSDGTGSLDSFLAEQMANYYTISEKTERAREIWNGIQYSYGCCGYNGFADWKNFSESILPESCCEIRHDYDGHKNCTYESENINADGCKNVYKKANIFIALTYFTLAITIAVLEMISVVVMKKLYLHIRDEVYDERSNLSIIGGKFCSLCDIDNAEYDDEEGERNDVSTVGTVTTTANFTQIQLLIAKKVALIKARAKVGTEKQ